MTEPLVSIIIPCYNYAHFLSDAVNSVLLQSHTNWECLLVDDGSTDATQAVAAKLAAADPRIRYYYKTNGGLSSARNYGMQQAAGAFICFLDADDLFDADKLKAQVAAFLKNPGADLVYGKAMFFESGNPKKLYPSKNKTAASALADYSSVGNNLLALLVKHNLTVVSAPLLKKELIARVGNFDLSYKSYEDWQFWLRCALAGCRFEYAAEPAVCTYIRFGHESMMSDQKKLLRAGIQLRRYLAAHLPPRLKFYNAYRLLRTRLKLLISK